MVKDRRMYSVDYGCGKQLDSKEKRLILDRFGEEVDKGIYRFMYTYHRCGGDHPSGWTVWCTSCAVKAGKVW